MRSLVLLRRKFIVSRDYQDPDRLVKPQNNHTKNKTMIKIT
jgi:hypothetical protein